jgi:hypothetical protein
MLCRGLQGYVVDTQMTAFKAQFNTFGNAFSVLCVTLTALVIVYHPTHDGEL